MTQVLFLSLCYRGGNSVPERLDLAIASREVAGTSDHSLLERRVGPQEALGQQSGHVSPAVPRTKDRRQLPEGEVGMAPG